MNILENRGKVLEISLYAILSAFVVELFFGLYANSLGLITDSMHALLDSVVTIVLLIAAKIALKPPDKEHTYGHGKVESLGGLFGGIAIFLIAIFFIYESITRLADPQPQILPSLIAIVGGLYTIGVDVFRVFLLGKSLKKFGGATIKADFYHAFMDLGTTSVAILGIVVVSYGFESGDFVSALILGVVLAILSLKLIHRTALDLTDIISPKLVKKVEKIVENTEGVVSVGPILMRRSGDRIFSEITLSLRGDTSFEKAHEVSDDVEKNIKNELPNFELTIHFEPSWKEVPLDSKIYDLASSIDGVKSVHNVSSYKSNDKIYVSLHVMVEQSINLHGAHNISELAEQKIKNDTDANYVTIHLEPYVSVPNNPEADSKNTEYRVRKILCEFNEIKEVGRIDAFYFRDLQKIDVSCSFDGDESIEKIHELTSQIEKRIKTEFKNAIITIHPEPI